MYNYESSGEIFEVDAESDLNTAASSDNPSGFKASLHNAESVVNWSIDFIKVEVVGASEDNGAALRVLETLY